VTAPAPACPPYDGRHLIADLHGCSGLDDSALIERILTEAAAAAGATLLEIRLHAFGAGNGVTGMALLAESHISIHTWPEHGYAAVDIFICGIRHRLEEALRTISLGLQATSVVERIVERGYRAAPAG
jgi:S-adenosylmethionine decarboxylase